MNKEIKKELNKEKEASLKLKRKIEKLKKITPNEENLEYLNEVAREFFKEKLNLKDNLTYLELAEKFKEKNAINFCLLMSDLRYSNNKTNPLEIKKAIKLFLSIKK